MTGKKPSSLVMHARQKRRPCRCVDVCETTSQIRNPSQEEEEKEVRSDSYSPLSAPYFRYPVQMCAASKIPTEIVADEKKRTEESNKGLIGRVFRMRTRRDKDEIIAKPKSWCDGVVVNALKPSDNSLLPFLPLSLDRFFLA